jgi:hypothetical protein
MADRMSVSLINNSQRTRYETLSQRDMTFHFYLDHYAMGALGIPESVRYLTNQIGWDRFAFSSPLVYRNLTLEFLSSLSITQSVEPLFIRGLTPLGCLGTPTALQSEL